jgi:hypothetical protein
MPHTGDVHVVPKGDRWAVEIEGDGAGSTHETQEDAISAGRQIAQQNRSELLIHGEDGQIRERSTFGEDPRSTPG